MKLPKLSHSESLRNALNKGCQQIMIKVGKSFKQPKKVILVTNIYQKTFMKVILSTATVTLQDSHSASIEIFIEETVPKHVLEPFTEQLMLSKEVFSKI